MGDFKIFKKAGISDFLGFMFFFFIFIVLIIILSWFGFFNTNTEQTAFSNFKNQDYFLTINNFLNQKIFPANLIGGEKNENISFLDVLSYDLSRIDSGEKSIFERSKVRDRFLKFSSILNFKVSYRDNEFIFKKKILEEDVACVPVVSDPGFFSFSVPVFYYNITGGLVSETVVFSNLDVKSVGDAFSMRSDFVPESQRLCVTV